MFYDYINIKRNILILLNTTFFQPKAFFSLILEENIFVSAFLMGPGLWSYCG